MGKIQHEIFLFAKAQVSAQIGTATDYTINLFLAEVCGVYYVLSTFLGALSGGIVNCTVNYKWVFGSGGQQKRYIVLKYFMVWGVSILLNTTGTYLFTELTGCHYILGRAMSGCIVAVAWTYQMHRLFVFRKVHSHNNHENH